MRYGMKRLNKRQIKKMNSDNHFVRNQERYYAMYMAGFQELNAIVSMMQKGVNKEKILRKAEDALKCCLRILAISYDKFLIEYQNVELCKYYNKPYSPNATIDDAFDSLESTAHYISDRYCNYRLYELFYRLELCRYFMGEKTVSTVSFKTEDEILTEFKTLFNTEVKRTGTIEDFAKYYNNHTKEVTEINGRKPYEEDFYNRHTVWDYLRHVTDYKKEIQSESNTLHHFDLYQMLLALKQCEFTLKTTLFETEATFA
jgi:hypothetical protein